MTFPTIQLEEQIERFFVFKQNTSNIKLINNKLITKYQDGYELDGESKTSCVYGNWTGRTPSCKEMYCAFPGYLENGKILLVGNMGLYDYRPYVRKIKLQIVFIITTFLSDKQTTKIKADFVHYVRLQELK